MDTWTDFIYFILFLYTLYILSSLFIYFIYSASFIRDMFYSLYILYIFYSLFLYTLYIWFSLYLQSHVLVFSGEWRHCFPINFSSPTTDWIRSPAIKPFLRCLWSARLVNFLTVPRLFRRSKTPATTSTFTGFNT